MPPKRLRNPLWLCTALVISMTTLLGVGQTSAFQAANLSGTPARLATLTGQPSTKTADGDCESGSLDGDRFSVERQSVWRGTRKPGSVCQTTFAAPTPIGSILQITGVHPYQLKNAFRNDAWQVSDDGEAGTMLHETVVIRETRRFRIHRLQQAITPKKIRLVVKLSHSAALAPREVEFDSAVDAEIPFPAWIVAVSSDEDPDKVSLGIPFISLARLCEGWEKAPAQTIRRGDFDPGFAFTEPRPLGAFLSTIFWSGASAAVSRGGARRKYSSAAGFRCGAPAEMHRCLPFWKKPESTSRGTAHAARAPTSRCCSSIRILATLAKLPVEMTRKALPSGVNSG